MTRAASPNGNSLAQNLCDPRSWIPWAAPFILYILILGLPEFLPLSPTVSHLLRLFVCGSVLVLCSRKILDFRPRRLVSSAAVGILVFLVWVGPDLIFPGYRAYWLFSNGLMGQFDPNANASMASAPLSFFVLRLAVSVLLVPIVEELFWRGFLMRFLIQPDFASLQLGAWQWSAFLLIAVLFGFEHGIYWDVGIAAGLIYNGWMVRTKSLADLIWAHAVTNGLLAGYVMALGRWEFWP